MKLLGINAAGAYDVFNKREKFVDGTIVYRIKDDGVQKMESACLMGNITSPRYQFIRTNLTIEKYIALTAAKAFKKIQ